MNKNSTQHLILLKAYNEINILEGMQLDSMLNVDSDLMDNLNQIESTKLLLNRAFCDPHPTSVQLILEASLSSQLEAY